jgi:hypothetical protein
MSARHVVVDGSNIATEGRSLPSLKQLDEAVREYLIENPDHIVTVVVDATFGHRIPADERSRFEEAESGGDIVCPPAGAIGRGDAFLLRVADKVGAVVLSNDSFQEFHGEYEWLFDKGRLIGGKPVPGVGWIFTPRSPVRGPKSRESVKEAKRKRRSEPTEGSGLDMASERMRGRGGERKLQRAIAVAVEEAVEPEKEGRKRRRRRRGGDVPSEPLNEPLSFISFIAAHQLGEEVEAIVEEFSSHGAFVSVDGARCYLPLSAMGDVPPRSARDLLRKGEKKTFVVQAFDAMRRGIEVAFPGFAHPAGAPTSETIDAEIHRLEPTGEEDRPEQAEEMPETAGGAADVVPVPARPRGAARLRSRKRTGKAGEPVTPPEGAEDRDEAPDGHQGPGGQGPGGQRAGGQRAGGSLDGAEPVPAVATRSTEGLPIDGTPAGQQLTGETGPAGDGLVAEAFPAAVELSGKEVSGEESQVDGRVSVVRKVVRRARKAAGAKPASSDGKPASSDGKPASSEGTVPSVPEGPVPESPAAEGRSADGPVADGPARRTRRSRAASKGAANARSAVEAAAVEAGAVEAGAVEAGAVEAGAVEAGAVEAGAVEVAAARAGMPEPGTASETVAAGAATVTRAAVRRAPAKRAAPKRATAREPAAEGLAAEVVGTVPEEGAPEEGAPEEGAVAAAGVAGPEVAELPAAKLPAKRAVAAKRAAVKVAGTGKAAAKTTVIAGPAPRGAEPGAAEVRPVAEAPEVPRPARRTVKSPVAKSPVAKSPVAADAVAAGTGPEAETVAGPLAVKKARAATRAPAKRAPATKKAPAARKAAKKAP